jgi:hypothetical protein
MTQTVAVHRMAGGKRTVTAGSVTVIDHGTNATDEALAARAVDRHQMLTPDPPRPERRERYRRDDEFEDQY